MQKFGPHIIKYEQIFYKSPYIFSLVNIKYFLKFINRKDQWFVDMF